MKLRFLAAALLAIPAAAVSGPLFDLSHYGQPVHPPRVYAAAETGLVAFTSNKDGNREIYVADAGLERQINVTKHRADDSHASWAPNGKRIAFVSNRRGIHDIFVVNYWQPAKVGHFETREIRDRERAW